jgi:hypothetical protein
MGRSRKKKLPFFLNAARIRTAESYFEENYKPEGLYKLHRIIRDAREDREYDDVSTTDTCVYEVPLSAPAISSNNNDSKSNLLEAKDSCNEELHMKPSQWMSFDFIWTSFRRILSSFRPHRKRCKLNTCKKMAIYSILL